MMMQQQKFFLLSNWQVSWFVQRQRSIGFVHYCLRNKCSNTSLHEGHPSYTNAAQEVKAQSPSKDRGMSQEDWSEESEACVCDINRMQTSDIWLQTFKDNDQTTYLQKNNFPRNFDILIILDIFDSDFPRNSATRSFALFSLVWPYHILSRCSRLGGVSALLTTNPGIKPHNRGTTQHRTTSMLPRGQPLTAKAVNMPSPTFTYVLHVARFHLLMLKLGSTWIQMI